jgi:hypothetical protein
MICSVSSGLFSVARKFIDTDGSTVVSSEPATASSGPV